MPGVRAGLVTMFLTMCTFGGFLFSLAGFAVGFGISNPEQARTVAASAWPSRRPSP